MGRAYPGSRLFAELAKDYGISSDIMFVYQGEMFREETMQELIRMLRQVLWGMLFCERLEQIALAFGSALQLLDRF